MLKCVESEKRASNSITLSPDQYKELEEMIARLKDDVSFSNKENRQNPRNQLEKVTGERGPKR
jgi:hypothetical protein